MLLQDTNYLVISLTFIVFYTSSSNPNKENTHKIEKEFHIQHKSSMAILIKDSHNNLLTLSTYNKQKNIQGKQKHNSQYVISINYINSHNQNYSFGSSD